MNKEALVVGVSGLVGHSLAEHLVSNGWEVTGLARRPSSDITGVQPIAADLLSPTELEVALRSVHPSHVFYGTWSRHPTEAENIHVNGSMVHNLLEILLPKESIEHFALVTGLKHYLGPWEMYAKGNPPPTPFRETLPRLDIPNFYYTLEDELFSAARGGNFGWTVHRPHTLIGYAERNVMNMGATIGLFAAYCKETGHPFAFPGNEVQWQGLTDVTDAKMLAKHLEWASVTPLARNEALHVVNGDVFRWKWMWGQIADWFGLEAIPFSGSAFPLVDQMATAGPVWNEIARKYDLVEPDLSRLASFWHTDGDLQRPFECVTDMSKSRQMGFVEYQTTEQAFVDVFERLAQQRLIPPFGRLG